MLQPLYESKRDWKKDFENYLKENRTLAYMMLKNAEKFKDYDALMQKNKDGKWESVTWKKFGDKIRAIAKALLDMNLQPGEMCAVFSGNRAEWAIADLGVLATRAVSVPIYATNSKEEAEYIVNDAEIKIIFTGDEEQYNKAKTIIKNNKFLKLIVAFDKETKITGNDSIYFDDLIIKGNNLKNDDELNKRLDDVNPDDILTLIYTSGTTGNPKGAIHTHRSFMNGIFPSYTRFPEANTETVSLAILPLSHVFERMWSYGCMSMGVKIVYCPDPRQFIDVMSDIRPHFMTSVPRIWQKIYAVIHEGLKTAPTIKRKLFEWATNVGIEEYRKKSLTGKGQSGLRYKIADKIIFSKVRAKLGAERCNVYHIGGSAFAPDINEFFLAFGINIIQGFGLTEFFPVCVGYRDTAKPAYCGPMLQMVEARISDEGEIQLKGGMCMSGYYKKPEATKECFTPDGWFKTQDIGEITTEEKHGDLLTYIKITDRIKELIITSGGKNISPQQIEVLLGEELFIEQFVSIGEERKFITALVVPNFVILDEYCQKNDITYSSREELVNKPEIIKLYENLIEKRTISLGNVEKIKKFTLLTEELTQEGGELTPTLKLKRKAIAEKYSKQIDEMYKE
ncbi:MAG: long-chain fatty acid--CoA ligase [Leptospirales bacterium]|nr:long-chain fatty acid--CoA ligase [Leptospirales bacterium]